MAAKSEVESEHDVDVIASGFQCEGFCLGEYIEL